MPVDNDDDSGLTTAHFTNTAAVNSVLHSTATSAPIIAGQGDSPTHCSYQSPPLFVFLAYPRGSFGPWHCRCTRIAER